LDLAACHVDVQVEIDPGVEANPELDALRQAIEMAVRMGMGQGRRPFVAGMQPEIEVDLLLTSDERVQQLNRDYRAQDKPTDVLSFSQLEGDAAFVAAPSGRLVLGDIVISVETARRQAQEQGHPLEAELRHLAAHGALHLLGYDHETDEDEARMNALAAEALASP